MNTYRPKHFQLQELVGPEFYKRWGERCWEWLDTYMLVTEDQLREKFGAITINDWADGGAFKESGLRDFGTSTGAGYSLHKFGKGYDNKFKLVTPPEAWAYIRAHRDEFPYLTTVEDPEITKTWLHADNRNHAQPWIWVVRP